MKNQSLLITLFTGALSQVEKSESTTKSCFYFIIYLHVCLHLDLHRSESPLQSTDTVCFSFYMDPFFFFTLVNDVQSHDSEPW